MKTTILALLVALRAVESTSGLDPNARGNDLQITPICVRDVNRIYGTHYTMRDVTDRRRAEEIAVLYLTYWGPRCAAPGEPTAETFARVWHRGPSKWKDAKGAAYWRKVRRASSWNSRERR